MTQPRPSRPQPDPRPVDPTVRRSIDVSALPKPGPEPVLTWTVGTGPVGGLAVDDVARLVATGNDRGHVSLFDLDTGEHRGRFLTDGWVWSLTFSPDHRRLTAVGLHGSVWCWELGNRRRLVDGVVPGTQAQNGRPSLSRCGSRMAMMKSDGLMMWDVRGFTRTGQTRPLGSIGECVAFDEPAEHAFFAAGYNTIGRSVPTDMIRRVNGGLETMGPPSDFRAAPLDEHRNRLFRVDGRLVDLPDALVVQLVDRAVILGDRQLVTSRWKFVHSFDLVTGSRLGPALDLPEPAQHSDVRGNLVAVIDRGGWLVLNWRTGDLVAGRRVRKAPVRKAPPTPAASPRGKSTTRKRSSRKPLKPTPSAMRVRLTGSGSHVVVAYNSGLVELYDVDDHRPVRS